MGRGLSSSGSHHRAPLPDVPPRSLPRRVLLVGDSVCVSPAYSFGSSGYAPIVAKRLRTAGVDVTWWPRSSGTLVLLAALRSDELPLDVDLIHFNGGLHDVAIRDPSYGPVVDLPAYLRNLHLIVVGLRQRTAAQLV